MYVCAKILIGFVLGHDAGGETELRDDFLIVVDKAAEELGNIAALPAQMASDFADFLIDHSKPHFVKNARVL